MSPTGKTVGGLIILLVLQIALCSCSRNNNTAKTSKASPTSGASATSDRVPTFVYVEEAKGGCSRVFFYKGSADGREFLTVGGRMEELKMTAGETKTFDLEDSHAGLEIAVDLYDRRRKVLPYCNDVKVHEADNKLESWKGTKGKITITCGEVKSDGTFTASVRLENVEFVNELGKKATLTSESISDVRVGWGAGA